MSASSASPRYKLPPVIQLRPYQQAWIDDPARFCFAAKSARIGFSYATGLRRYFRCLRHDNRTSTILSASKAQSVEFVEQLSRNLQAIGATQQLYNEYFEDKDGKTEILQQRIQLPNGSRIIALPANPRTARGYPGDAVLDEFAHHEDSYSIWAAVTRQVALGNELDVLSTPNGQVGKYFDLAREFDVADGVAPSQNPKKSGNWSVHWIDIHRAIAQGCPIDIDQMRDLIKDDDTFAQEFLCVFLAAVGAWLPLELIAQCEHAGATIALPPNFRPVGPLYGGIDVARSGDKSVFWLDEILGDVAWTRMVLSAHNMPFPEQEKLFTPFVRMTTRTALDSTGMGIALYDYLNQNCGGRVMGVSFAGTNDNGVKMKTDLAIRIKKQLEKSRSRIPYDPQIRQALMAIKREATSSGVKFDAPRIEMDTAVAGGQRRKVFGHADEFWAKALADFAADTGAHLSTEFVAARQGQAYTRTGAYL